MNATYLQAYLKQHYKRFPEFQELHVKIETMESCGFRLIGGKNGSEHLYFDLLSPCKNYISRVITEKSSPEKVHLEFSTKNNQVS